MQLIDPANRADWLRRYHIPEGLLRITDRPEAFRHLVEPPQTAYSYLAGMAHYKILSGKTVVPLFGNGTYLHALVTDKNSSNILCFEVENDEVYRDFGLNWQLLMFNILFDYFELHADEGLTRDQFIERGTELGFHFPSGLFELIDLPIEEYNERYEDLDNWKMEIARTLGIE